MHQSDVVENRDVHFAQVFASRAFEEILVRNTHISASPMIAVCITTMSFTSRVGAITRGSTSRFPRIAAVT